MKAMAIWLACTALAAAQEPRLTIRTPSGAGGEALRLLTVRLDLDAIAACYEPPPPLNPASLAAAVRLDGQARVPLPTQFDADPDSDGRRGTLTVAMPAEHAGREVEVTFAGGARAHAPFAPLEVTVADGVITVAGEHYAVTHDPARMGGLPSRIELRPAGKVFDNFSLNDRVYHRELAGWYVRQDPEPKVTLAARGPLRVEVRVEARYMRDNQQPPSRPTAVYSFSYYPGSPRVDVAIDARQEQAFAWAELHGIEINFPDQSFPRWVGGLPLEEGEFTAEKRGWQKAWGALVDGDAVVGLLNGARFYDGRGEYGTYLHGPWVGWSDTAERLAVALFLSGQTDSRERLAAAAGGTGLRSVRVVAVPDAVAEALGRLRAAAAGAAPAKARRVRWWTGLAEARIGQGDLAGGWAFAKALDAALPTLPDDAARLDAWFAERTGWRSLVSDRLGCGFAGPRLASLYDLKLDRECLAAPTALWRLTLRDADRKTHDYGPDVFAPLDGEAEADLNAPPGPPELSYDGDGGTALRIRFPGFPVVTANSRPGPTVILDLQLTGPRLATKLTVQNDTDFAVQRADTPVLALGHLSPAGGETLFLPVCSGRLYADPLAAGLNRRGGYPGGWWTMQYTAFYDGQGGVLVGALDPVASTKRFAAEASPGVGVLSQATEWPLPDMSVAGNDWEQPGIGALEVFDGDWYDAAMIYRRWVEAEAEWWPARSGAKQSPAAFKDVAVWALASGFAHEPDNVVPRTIEFAEYMGVPTALHWYNWHVIPFDDQYPHYDPTKPGMAEGTAELQRAGVRVMPYINARLWDSRLEDFQQEAHRYATVNEDGEPYIETYGSKVPLAPMCPYTRFWQDKVRDIVLWIQNDLGTDGVYLDQVAAAEPRLCFNPDHGHPLGGGHWWTTDGYWPMLAKLRAAMAPGKFITTECNAEPYVQYFDGYLTWHWQEQDAVPAFSAIYADQVVLFSRAYGGGPDIELACRMKAAQSLCFGEQLGWLDPGVIKRPSGAFLRQCARTRYQLRDYLAGGRMLHPPALSGDIPVYTADWQWSGHWPVSLPAVQTAAWRAPDGRVALIFANFSPADVRAEFHFDAARYGYAPDAAITVTRRTPEAVEEPRRLAASWSETLTLPAEQVVVYEVSAP